MPLEMQHGITNKGRLLFEKRKNSNADASISFYFICSVCPNRRWMRQIIETAGKISQQLSKQKLLSLKMKLKSQNSLNKKFIFILVFYCF